MGVAASLGLEEGLNSPLLIEADGAWSGWASRSPGLSGPSGPADLQGWLRKAGPADADALLRTLVRIGSPSGWDDPRAVAATCWALLPGACAVASRLRSLSPQVDDLVASHLWLQLRLFPWNRLNRVAANVLANTRSLVLADHGLGRLVGAGQRSTIPVDPHGPFWRQPASPVLDDPVLEVSTLLSDAAEHGLLSQADHLLLGLLLSRAEPDPGNSGSHDVGDRCAGDGPHQIAVFRLTGACRGRGGLLTNRLVESVARDTGLSSATIRRRVRRSTEAIAAAARSGLIAAA